MEGHGWHAEERRGNYSDRGPDPSADQVRDPQALATGPGHGRLVDALQRRVEEPQGPWMESRLGAFDARHRGIVVVAHHFRDLWDRIAVNDGGWFEWSQDPINNPIEVGEPETEFAA
jgi:hypothetical protein